MTSLARSFTRPALRTRATAERAATVLVAGTLVLVLHLTGTLGAIRGALVFMGFDADRAQLIESLLAGSMAAFLGVLATGRSGTAALAGAGASLALFGPMFRQETQSALASTGVQGEFDPGGWLLTVLTLVVIAVLVGWASAMVGRATRATVVTAGLELAAARRDHAPWRLWRPTGLVAIVIVVVLVAVPTFGDMVNYAPDVRMRTGSPQGVPLVSGADGGLPGAIVPPGAASSPQPSGILPPVTSGSTITDAARPWLAWRPSGPGQIVDATLPAPWTGTRATKAHLAVYLPPGYASSPDRRYPVLYEVPWSFGSWANGVDIRAMLDGLIDSGRIPAQIVVFITTAGSPYSDTECVDSTDGREHLETFMSTTVPAWVDATYRTIARPEARAIFGFSQGGYCAPMLALRHPDVFRIAVSFSGYYQAALRSNATVNAALPFGGNQAMIRSHSPIDLAAGLAPSLARSMLMVLSSDATEPIYGPQSVAFVAALRAAGAPYVLLPTRLGHAWQAVRLTLPTALEIVAGRQVALGVYGPTQAASR